MDWGTPATTAPRWPTRPRWTWIKMVWETPAIPASTPTTTARGTQAIRTRPARPTTARPFPTLSRRTRTAMGSGTRAMPARTILTTTSIRMGCAATSTSARASRHPTTGTRTVTVVETAATTALGRPIRIKRTRMGTATATRAGRINRPPCSPGRCSTRAPIRSSSRRPTSTATASPMS